METILIVDDNADNRNLLRVILNKHHYTLFEAENGLEAMAIATSKLPDLILLDIMMPIKDGYETCAELKREKTTQDIPVIFLSARDETSDKVKGLELGAADYITKPFNKAEVVARVKTHLKLYGLARSLVLANENLKNKQKKLDEDLAAAAQIQYSLIPSTVPEIDHYSFAYRFEPSDLSGGDIFNIHRLDESNVVMYIVDVSGHGVPAAMVTVAVAQCLRPHGRTIIKEEIDTTPFYKITTPLDVVCKLDEQFPIERFEKFFTIVYLVLNTKTGEIRYSNAGHPFPIIVRKSGQLEILETGGTVIGLGDVVPFEEGKAQIHPGDRLYLYTDGIVEFSDKDEEYFGEDRLYQELVRHRAISLDESCDSLLDTLRVFGKGLKPQDDITLVALEYGL